MMGFRAFITTGSSDMALLQPQPQQGQVEAEEEEEEPEEVEIYELQYIGLEDMPYCCGIRVLGEAEIGPDRLYNRNQAKSYDEVMADLKAFIATGANEGGDENEGKPGLLLYTLTKDQKEMAAVLKRCGFTIMQEFKNPKTGRIVRLYRRPVNQ